MALTGCEVVYDSQQQNALNDCDKLLSWNDRSECIKQNKKSYDQYEKQRKDLMEKGTEK